MIFSPELCEAVLSGRKTVTRRRAKPVWGDDVLHPCRYQQGHDYAVQPGRGKAALGRIQILDTELQPLSDALCEYREEGFRTPEAFTRYWRSIYGDFQPDLLVWRIEFAPAKPEEKKP